MQQTCCYAALPGFKLPVTHSMCFDFDGRQNTPVVTSSLRWGTGQGAACLKWSAHREPYNISCGPSHSASSNEEEEEGKPCRRLRCWSMVQLQIMHTCLHIFLPLHYTPTHFHTHWHGLPEFPAFVNAEPQSVPASGWLWSIKADEAGVVVLFYMQDL